MKKNGTGLTIALGIVLIIQIIFIVLMLAYAFFGTYEHGVASNFLSALWGMGLVIFQLAYNPVPLIMGIVGLVKQKGNVLMLIISVLLIISFFISPFTVLIAIGKQF
ncbi:hypothetical protein SAMN02910370_02809 [Lachnospiraceae bacterium XPB1003]|nr:hypothetical protein SAMN02910370_02809 [Lachnospiraceae bacterium XPB1003]